MGQVNHEPSMEDILASIKRIIAEDSEAAAAGPRGRGRREAEGASPPVLEVVPDEPAPEPTAAAPQPATAQPAAAAAAAPPQPVAPPSPVPPSRAAQSEVLELTSPIAPPAAPLVSEAAASASRDALASLSSIRREAVAPPAAAPENPFEAMVREMLRPMLKDWLDDHLPKIIEQMVAAEIARIAGR